MSDFNNYQSESKVFERDWSVYYNAVVGRPPRDTLLEGLAHFDTESLNQHQTPVSHSRFAVDLGCGEGRDTVELLRRGWRVLAIDGEAETIARLLECPDINRQFLKTHILHQENPKGSFISAILYYRTPPKIFTKLGTPLLLLKSFLLRVKR